MRTALRYGGPVVMFIVGVLAVVSGEADDSPGLQGIGVLMAGAAVALAWRTRRPNSGRDRRA